MKVDETIYKNYFYKKVLFLLFFGILSLMLLVSFGTFYIYFRYYMNALAAMCIRDRAGGQLAQPFSGFCVVERTAAVLGLCGQSAGWFSALGFQPIPRRDGPVCRYKLPQPYRDPVSYTHLYITDREGLIWRKPGIVKAQMQNSKKIPYL